MITNPNTLGLFERDIEEICRTVHRAGGQVYLDGANFNAVVGVTRPGDWGVDVMHLNLHKTFSTPHGGGGPGAGPVCVRGHLEPYLPTPVVVERGGKPLFDFERPKSIGKVHGWHGNVAVHLRAWAYVRSLGGEGLRLVAQMAVLNANYLRSKVKDIFPVPHGVPQGTPCKHEFVASAKRLKEHGVRGALDLAKALIDEGFHPPTIYFPLVVDEALMIEPTETESKETLDAFADALRRLAERAATDPESLRTAPHRAPVSRVDEATAARVPCLCWESPQGSKQMWHRPS